MEAQAGFGREVAKAPTFPLKVIISVEIFVCSGQGKFDRFVAFIRLLKVWGCFRGNDIQGIRPSRMVLNEDGLKLVLERSKTTGPGKRTGELFAFVVRDAGSSGWDWIAAGFELLSDRRFSYSRDYLLPQ